MSNSDQPLAPFRAKEDPQGYVLASSLNYTWDVATLEWIKSTSSGGGGGAVTIADGADVAEGSVSDAAWVAGDGTVISLLKAIAGGGGGGAVTIANGADVAEGATTDAAVVTDTTGTVSGKLRGLVKWAFERMPASLGQKTMANSLPVVLASDQSTVVVSGAVTNTVLSVVGGGVEAAAQRVTIASDSTGLLSVDDNGGSFTIDSPQLPAALAAGGGLKVEGVAGGVAQPISAASLPLPTGASTSALQTQPGVDIGDVTINNAAGGSAVNIQDGGNSITVDGTVAVSGSVAITNAALSVVGGGVEATALRVTIASDSTGLLSVDDNGGSLTVDAVTWPLPTGAATAALQTQPGVDIGDVTVNNAAGGSAVNVQDGGNSLTVDAVTWPLPTGAATAALQTQPGVDIGDVTVNNAAGASAVNVQDGGNSLTVDAPVGTPVFVRLSDGASPITTLPVSIAATVPVSIAATVTVAGAKTNNSAAPGATNIGTLPAVANVAAPTYVEGNQVALSTDLTGAVRITGSISASSTATATLAAPLYTEAQVAAFSQDLNGALRVNSASDQLSVFYRRLEEQETLLTMLDQQTNLLTNERHSGSRRETIELR